MTNTNAPTPRLDWPPDTDDEHYLAAGLVDLGSELDENVTDDLSSGRDGTPPTAVAESGE